jgi:Na+/phosphate symporter
MKDQRKVVNPFRILSPKLDAEAARTQDLHKTPVSDEVSPEEGLFIMLSKVIEMGRILSRAVVTTEPESITACEKLAEETHTLEGMVTSDLVSHAGAIGENLFRIVVRFPARFERIGDMFENILACCRIKQRDGIPFSDKAHAELAAIFALNRDMLTNLRDSLMVRNKALIEHLSQQRLQMATLLSDARFGHWDRIERGFCAPQASSLYLDILDSFGAINDYVRKMCESLLAIED